VHTKLLMRLSALFLGVLGLIASFMPQEILARYGTPSSALDILLIQVAGALYLGFAILNWMARDILIGGIYARPVALGNFLHFAVVTLTLWKSIGGGALRGHEIIAGAIVYSVFAAWFGLVLFGHPGKD
jgi:hypothetical protein